MKKTTLLLITLFSLANLTTFAQTRIGVGDVLRNAERSQQISPVSLDADVEGSPYLNEEWLPSVIETKDDQKIEVKARYRYYDNTVEIMKENDEGIYALGKNYTKSITIGNQQFITLSYKTEKGEPTSGFFELLTEGQLQLLIQYDKVLSKAVNNGYQNTPTEIKAVWDFLVYDSNEEKMVVYEKVNKKSILPLLGDHSKQIENYAKKNKLSFRKSRELAKILNYYNSICCDK